MRIFNAVKVLQLLLIPVLTSFGSWSHLGFDATSGFVQNSQFSVEKILSRSCLSPGREGRAGAHKPSPAPVPFMISVH